MRGTLISVSVLFHSIFNLALNLKVPGDLQCKLISDLLAAMHVFTKFLSLTIGTINLELFP